AGEQEERHHHRQHREHGDLGDRVVVQGLSHDQALRAGSNLPTPLGLRTLTERWASTGCDPRDTPENDSQADCAGSQLERLSNKLEPSGTIPITSYLVSGHRELEPGPR